MGTDPHPEQYIVATVNSKCAMTHTDSYRPELAYPFEMQRRMPWISFELLVSTIGNGLDRNGQSLIAAPKAWSRSMDQRSLQRPAA